MLICEVILSKSPALVRLTKPDFLLRSVDNRSGPGLRMGIVEGISQRNRI